MKGCKVFSKDDYIDSIISICDESANMDLNAGATHIENGIKKLIDDARLTSEVDKQLQLLNEALDEFYANPEDDYGQHLSLLFPPGQKSLLFNPNRDESLAENHAVSSTFEEAAKASRNLRQKNFLETKFKHAPNAKLYFKRSVLNDMVETFLVDRSGDNPRYFTSQEEMNKNVRAYKQKLLDRIFEYFDNDPYLKEQAKTLPRTMYQGGNYTNVLSQLKAVFDGKLSPEFFAERGKSLDEFYREYRDGNKLLHDRARRFLDAYNAWIILQNFDTVVQDNFGSIVSVGNSHINQHDGDLHKYEIKGRATNMWNNWRNSDDIADMSEVISDVTQALINTSRMYAWGVNEAYHDRYVSFHDFNYVIGLIKKQAFNSTSDTIKLDELVGLENTSIYTKKLLLDILSWNRVNGNFEIGADGKPTNRPKAVTWKQLIARINENPQRYLHAAFDILCNTNILDSYNLNDYEKSLIWSFNKEVFGGNGNSRSLYNLHTLSPQDNIYQIITQVAASTFPEDYLQYYEKQDGSIGTRLLQDYAVDGIKNTILQDIQQTAVTLTRDQYTKYGISYQARKDQPNYLQEININIEIPTGVSLKINATSNSVTIEDHSPEEWQQLWNSPQVQKAFKDILGVNFEGDPDLKNAYMEIVKGPYRAIQDLGQLLGRVVFNAVVNNEFVPNFPGALKNTSALRTFIVNQYGNVVAPSYNKGIKDSGLIPVLPVNTKDAMLGNLAMATAINSNLLAAAQSKTGEGTALANYTLSRMRNFYQNQLEMQCKKANSAVKDISFVVNTNGLFEGILSRRELKTLNNNQQSTQFSDQQSFQLSFINDFISGFIPNPENTSYIKNGKVSFLPTVNSDKTQIDGLLVNLNAKSHIPNGNGGFKTYLELTDSEVEEEMKLEFQPMYERIITNVNTELGRIVKLLPPNIQEMTMAPIGASVIEQNSLLLQALNEAFANDENLGKKPKQRITNGLHNLITAYNKTHSRNPIMLSSHVHYVFDDNGLLSSNKTLEALWGRFETNLNEGTYNHLSELYTKEQDYLDYLKRNGIKDVVGSHSFFKYKEHLTVENLIKMHFKVYLRGSDDVVRHSQQEIQFLRGEVKFTEAQKNDPAYAYLRQLNDEMKNWVSVDGTMILAKGIIGGQQVEIKTLEQLKQASDLVIHPMLSKLNRLDYLCTQQYTISTVGSHYVHKGGASQGSILVEEAKRWLASNKRNVAATSTVHLFQNKQLDGAPSTYNIAIIDDIKFDLYNVMGDLYLEGHAPLDGGMFVNAWMSDLENNSLAGEKAGLDKKQFGTFYSELYGAGGIVKTAGFAATNARMRRQKAWQNLQKNMTNRPWVKEFPDAEGNDINEIIDITKDYLGRPINYENAIKGQHIMYKRLAHDKPSQLAAYRLDKVEYLGDNNYAIWEVEIDAYGNDISEPVQRVENGSTAIKINTNWDLYTKLFGGFNSLEIGDDNKLTWSENSVRLMTHALNSVGYRKQSPEINESGIGDINTGLDQDDVWQPLKYADIHYTPNIGAIKSLQFNVNPDGDAVLNSETTMNFMSMRLAQLGIQLDKEHHADASDVSMPTQIIQACSNRSFTSEYSKEIYEALSVLTHQEIDPFLDGIKDVITTQNGDPAQLVETVTSLIVDNLLRQSGDDNSANAILKDLLEKAEAGKELKFVEDIKGKIPWSDPTISNKLFSSLSTTLTNMAVKMKFAGTLSVICPTDGVEKIYGDRLLNSFTQIYDSEGSTRTALSEDALINYQNSVKDGNEVDSDGRNMLVYDISRISKLRPNDGELDESYSRRVKLSQVSELKTQHNYIVEFADGSQEEITLNTPEDYYRVKNLTLLGKKISTPILWAHPAIGKTYSVENGGFSDRLIDWDVEFNRKRDLWIAQQSKTLLNSEDFKRARNEYLINWANYPEYIDFVKNEWERVKQKANKENKILVASPHMLLQLFPQDFTKVITMSEGDFVTRNIARNANNRENSVKWKAGIDQTIANYISSSSKNAQKVVTAQDNEYLETLLLNGNLGNELTQLANNTAFENGNIPVIKIYENVQKGRALGAYNVRFTDKATETRFQIFDLDSVNLMFKLNQLWTNSKKPIKGYELFQNLTPVKQQQLLNQIFTSSAFNGRSIHFELQKKFPNLPNFDARFIENLQAVYPNNVIDVIAALYAISKPRVYKVMQSDLFKLSSNYNKGDKRVYANRTLIDPVDIKTDAYELIMPKVYKTQFGLQEFDDLQEILRNKDFFVKRGLSRFACKLAHSDYDYELKNFNGDHVYILDKSKGIPEHMTGKIQAIFMEKRKGKTYRIDSDGNIIYEMSSDQDVVCKLGNTQVIITDNPLFYVQNLNYNTLKVSPSRVTDESYQALTSTLALSKRTNSKNYLKAITLPTGELFDLATFKEYNATIDNLTYETVKFNDSIQNEFKSVSQICRLILQNGRELHTSFEQSLELIAGRIPAQSQQSFMTQRVIGFDNADINTAMVSTFQLFLQGSDLDIDAVTLLGYEFDKNGKFVAWSPYFQMNSKDKLEASMLMPLPSGKTMELEASDEADNNFFEVYDKYFGTLFKPILLQSGNIKTIDGVPELQVDLNTKENIELFAQFLRDVKKYGIKVQGTLINGLIRPKNDNPNFYNKEPMVREDGSTVQVAYNLYKRLELGGLGIRPNQTVAIANQLLKVINTHNEYITTAEEHLRDKMAKNFIVRYIYKVAEAPCNQTEAQVGLDVSTKDVKDAARNSAMANASDSYAPGGAETKHKSVGEGQVGKACVGIGAVGIKANSTTQFYLSELWNYGSDWDREKILFRNPVRINNKVYRGFANMYTTQVFSEEEQSKFEQALQVLASLESEDQITQDVAVNIASLLSIAVDNAKDLALAKINSGPKLMGMYAYGLTLGIPITDLVNIMNSDEGRILTELTEGSYFNHDTNAFKVLDVFDKLDGQIGGDLGKYNYVCRRANNQAVSIGTKIRLNNNQFIIRNSSDALFAAMYEAYSEWYDKFGSKMRQGNRQLKKADNFATMIHHLLKNNMFDKVYRHPKTIQSLSQYSQTITQQGTRDSATNWIASIGQIINHVYDMQSKIQKFNSQKGRDLKVLAEGAEEMRILGSILSINKGLKPTAAEAETFIDTIENLVYNRKQILGAKLSESDIIDFHRFMLDENYQKDMIDEYEKVKHSVNILHLITKVPHFKAYLSTQLIPTTFSMVSSVKYRTVHKYRKNVDSNSDKPLSIFKMFEVDGRREKEQILKGLENLIHFKLLGRWLYDSKLQFKVPKDFKYFSQKGRLVSNSNQEMVINLWTEAGLASFKKYMEEVYIPQLKDDPSLASNEFIKNLIKISYNKTPAHSAVITYSLRGDLMAKQGRQAEMNQRMFADFQQLATLKFQPELGIPSLSDAFYLYAQYCYMGKKGKKSLMTLFDSADSRSSLSRSFNNHVAVMDTEGNISCSKEELIIWCAPSGGQQLKARWGYVTSNRELFVSLKQRMRENVQLTEEEREIQEEAQEAAMDDNDGRPMPKPEKFGVYKTEYLVGQYDRLTRNHFLLPSTNDKVTFTETMPIKVLNTEGGVNLDIKQDVITNVEFDSNLTSVLQDAISNGVVTKFKSVDDIKKHLSEVLKHVHIPYKVSLYTNEKQQIDLSILQHIIEQTIEC